MSIHLKINFNFETTLISTYYNPYHWIYILESDSTNSSAYYVPYVYISSAICITISCRDSNSVNF